jgi:histidinol-phosphate aminotransferase
MPATKNTIKNASRLHGYWIYKKFLSQSQYWPVGQREKYVLTNLRKTLVRAWEGSPYYRDQFRKSGFDPRTDFRSPEDLARLPLLTKADVRGHFNEIVDPRFERGSVVTHTSGSTGEPLPMRLNEFFMAFDNACLFRHWSWAGHAFGARMAALRTYVPTHVTDPLWRYATLKNTLYFSAYHLSPANCGEYVERILRFRPKFIKAYPSSICVFAEFAYPFRGKFDFLRGIFTSSETLLPSERDRIERTFGKKVFNWYGMTEPAVIITECEEHEGLHINWEYGYAEFLPSDDLAPNEFRLVTTGFHNPVMPFIRYDTGDIVRLYESSRTCRCGRTMPMVHSVVGRKDECIIMPDGRRLPSGNFYSVFREHPDVLKFQIVQYGRAEVAVKLLIRPGAPDVQGLLSTLREELRARLGQDITLNLEVTDRFLTNSDGKTLPVVRRIGTRSLEEKQEYATSLQSLRVAWNLERNGHEVFKLDWNEAERVPSPNVRKALRNLIDNDHYACWYPDPDPGQLLQAISAYVGVPPEHVVLTHGSDLGLELVANAFTRPGDKVLIVSPNYDHFRAMTEQRGAEILRFDYRGDAAFPCDECLKKVGTYSPRMIYLTNPNNPLGYALEVPVLERLSAECSRLSAILIIDEAYFEFYGITAASLVAQYSHCIVTRSFSKAFGMAGLRLGYLLAPLEIVRVLNRLNISKSVTMFAKVAALASMQDLQSVRDYVEEVRQSKEQFYALFQELRLGYQRSMSNFISFEHEKAPEIVRYLADRHILVRDGSRYSRGKGCVRVSVAGAQSSKIVIEALREFFAQSVKDDSDSSTALPVEPAAPLTSSHTMLDSRGSST